MNKNTLLGIVIISCIGVVFAIVANNDSETTENGISEENEEFKSDKMIMDGLQLQYDEIIKYSCMEAKPQSYFEVKLDEKILEVEHRLRYLSEQQVEIENIKNQVVMLNEKYFDSENQEFSLFEWECVNQKFWIDEYPHLQDILENKK
ncbi:MAG: hypothetical protein MAG458_01513 [Nitrosopumilus sp.]|nr:hypothetical protein [Nitrosopumilus sp.]